MAQEVDEADSEMEDEDREMSDEQKKTRKAELEAELDKLNSEDAAGVERQADQAAKDIADGEMDETTAADASEDAAEDIADSLRQRKGIVLTDEEVDGIARRIERRRKEIQTGESEEGGESTTQAPPERKPDRKPKSNHWSERRIGRRKKGDD